jgi:DNA helicase HerA-like ATPase
VYQTRSMYLGAAVSPLGGDAAALHMPPHHLVTHGLVLGMTGSGKTGLLMVMVEEAPRSGVPVIMIDVKGDLPNLLLAFPSFDPAAFAPRVSGHGPRGTPPSPDLPARLAAERQLESWKLGAEDIAQFRRQTALRVLTPRSSAGEPLHILSSLAIRTRSHRPIRGNLLDRPSSTISRMHCIWRGHSAYIKHA